MKICVKGPVQAFLAALLIILNGGCSGNQHDDPAPVIRPQEGAGLCDEVSTKLGPDGMGCDFAYPVPVQDGGTLACGRGHCECAEASHTGCITFEAWCVEQHANGVFWDTRCILDKVTACDQVDSICNTQ